MGSMTAMMGVALLNRAASGYCPAYHAMGISPLRFSVPLMICIVTGVTWRTCRKS